MASVESLPEHECERLLRAGVLGRLVLPTPGRTEVFPVNYAVMGDALLIRTTPGSLLDRYADGVSLLLEVDAVDHEYWSGWSVVARGRGERLDEDHLTLGERGSPGPPRWAPGRDVWIRLPWSELTGRRIGAGPMATPPVRRAWR
jgi:hypothetical protein